MPALAAPCAQGLTTSTRPRCANSRPRSGAPNAGGVRGVRSIARLGPGPGPGYNALGAGPSILDGPGATPSRSERCHSLSVTILGPKPRRGGRDGKKGSRRREEKRRAMVTAVRHGAAIRAVARAHNVSLSTVQCSGGFAGPSSRGPSGLERPSTDRTPDSTNTIPGGGSRPGLAT
jgi:hypothetical protein